MEDDPSGYLYSKACTQEALAYIKDHSASVIATDLCKVMWLYTWHKVPRSLADSNPRWDPVSNTVVDDGSPRAALQDIIYSIYWVPILLFFLVGVFLSRHHWRKLMPIYLILFANAFTASMTFADIRFRLEVDPCISIWAAYGVVGLVGKIWSRPSDHPTPLP